MASSNDIDAPSNDIIFNATVSKQEKPGVYNSISAALAAAPTNNNDKYYIHVEAGVYVERVELPYNLINIVLIGDGPYSTIIQWNRHAPQYNTFETATFTVQGDGFIAKYMGFENSAGPGFQAVAVVTTSTHNAFYKCAFLGYQDTLFALQGKHFYKECDIYGTIDYICGAAAAVFQSCNLYARFNKPVAFTAQNKDGGSTTPSGFVIQDCKLTVAAGVEPGFTAFLGRSWSDYSTVVVMESFLDNIIDPKGWETMIDGSTTDEVTYMEFNNRGPGAATGGRVKWKGYQDVSGHPDKVQSFTVHHFINNNPEWLHGTGIPYSSGLIYN